MNPRTSLSDKYFNLDKVIQYLESIKVRRATNPNSVLPLSNIEVWALCKAFDISIDDSPVDKSYLSKEQMLLDTNSKREGYLYFDGDEYYEYIGPNLNEESSYRSLSSLNLEDVIDYVNQFLSNGLIKPGLVTWSGEGFIFDINTAIAKVSTGIVTVPAGQVTLEPSDLTFDRKDVIYLEITEDFVGFKFLTGVPSSEPIQPQLLDPETQFFLTVIDVPANFTTPINIQTIDIYQENTEWLGSFVGTGSAIFSNVLFPFAGLLSIDVSDLRNNDRIIMDNEAVVSFEGYNVQSLRIRLKAEMNRSHSLMLQYLDADSNPVTNQVELNLIKNLVGEYQIAAINNDDLVYLNSNPIQKTSLVFRRFGGPQSFAGFYVDDWKLQGGIKQPSDGEDGKNINFLENVTYSELKALLDSSTLIVGQSYLITDFQTIHLIPFTTDINTGAIEPIIVTAKDINKIGSRVFSLTHPNDIIEYDVNDVLCENGTTPRKGKILFRHDIKLDTYAYYDWRQVRFRRWRILSKQEEVPVKLTETTFDLELTFSSFSTSWLNGNNRRFHVKFPETTHDAGPITITLRKGAATVTKELVRYDGTPWVANELSLKSGIITNCLVRDVFVFASQQTFGLEVVGTYSSRIQGPLLTIGDGLRYDVDPLDFVDYLTFNGDTYGVHMERTSQKTYNFGNMIGNNTIFLSTAHHVQLATHSTNNTYRSVVVNLQVLPENVNNIYNNQVRWSKIGREVVNCYYGGVVWHHETGDYSDVSTLYLPAYHSRLENGVAFSTVSFSDVSSRFLSLIENSFIMLGGSGGGSGRSGFTFAGLLRNGLLGFFNSTNVQIFKNIVGTSFYKQPITSTQVRSLNIETTPTPDGATQPLGLDSKGNVVIFTSDATLEAGIGLSIDVDGNIQLGDNSTLFYTDTPTVKDFFLTQTKAGLASYLYSGYGTTGPSVADAGFAVTNASNLGAEISARYDSVTSKSSVKFQINSSSGFTLLTIDQDIGFSLRDDIFQKGIVNFGNYEANFTARSLVTKQWSESNLVTLSTNQTNINGNKRFNGLVRFRRGVAGEITLHTSYEYPDADGQDYSLTLYNDAAGNNVKWYWNQVITLAISGAVNERLDYPVLGFRNGVTVIGADGYPTGSLGIETYYNNQVAPVTRYPLTLYSVGDAMFTGRIYAGKANFENTLFLTANDTFYSEGTVYARLGLRTRDAENLAVLDGVAWDLGNYAVGTTFTQTHIGFVRINGKLFRQALQEVV